MTYNLSSFRIYNKFLCTRHCYTADIPFGMVITMGREPDTKWSIGKTTLLPLAAPQVYPALAFQPTE